MSEAFREIIKYMLRVNRAVKSSELAVKLDLKIRTIHYEINKEKESLLFHGIVLESLGKAGYKIKVVDEAKAGSLLEELAMHNITKDELLEGILNHLLHAEDGCRLDDLAEALFVSRSTINRVMKPIRQILSKFDLSLEARPYSGIKITGSEMNKRLCIIKYFPDVLMEEEGERNIDSYRIIIGIIVRNVLEQYDFKIKDVRFSNLILHLSIAVYRIKNQNFVNDVVDVTDVSSVWEVANAIAGKIEEQFGIEVPQTEINYISLHLSGKQNISEFVANDEILERLLAHIFDKIERNLGYHMRHDFDLYMHLLLHIKPMLVRAKYNMQFENPLLDNIKIEMQDGFECALIAREVIREQTDFVLSDDELGYLAMHFSMSILGEKHKRRILIVCGSGFGTSSVLRKKIVNHFDAENYEIEVGDYLAIDKMSLSPYDYIFSTMPFENERNYPIIYVENVFTFNFEKYKYGKEDKDDVFSAFKPENLLVNLECQSKEEALSKMIKELVNQFHVGVEVGESIIKREGISTTEIGNHIAMPHPMKRMTEETIMLIGVLKNEITWLKRKVKCIIIICYAEKDDLEQDKMNDRITDFVVDAQKVTNFLMNPTYESLVRHL